MSKPSVTCVVVGGNPDVLKLLHGGAAEKLCATTYSSMPEARPLPGSTPT